MFKKNFYFTTIFICSTSFHSFADTLTNVAPLDFGGLEVSSSGSKDLTLDSELNTSSGTATVIDTHTLGDYTINCTTTTGDITIDLSSTTSGNLVLDTFNIFYEGTKYTTFPATSLPNPGGVNKTVKIGGKVTFNSSVTTGIKNLNLTFTLTCPP